MHTGPPKRILVLGSTGTGKSSLINLLTQTEKARVSDSPYGCTFDSRSFECVHNGEKYEFIDTAGLGEGHSGTVKARDAILKLIQLIKKNAQGFHLVLVVIRAGRVTATDEQNYAFFLRTLFTQPFPVGLVITHCENDDPMDAWYKDYGKDLKEKYSLKHDFACSITCKVSTRETLERIFAALRDDSRRQVFEAIQKHARDQIPVITSDNDFIATLKKGIKWLTKAMGWTKTVAYLSACAKDIYKALVSAGWRDEDAKAVAESVDEND